MVCRMSNEGRITATVVQRFGDIQLIQTLDHTIDLYPEKTVASIFAEIVDSLKYDPDCISVSVQNSSIGEHIALNGFKDKTLSETGVDLFNTNVNHTIVIEEIKKEPIPTDAKDESVPSGGNYKRVIYKRATKLQAIMPPPQIEASSSSQESSCSSNNYVGLVNQAMTCYLNSLLQALYMTPEFRNALYNWEFDGNNPSNSIPFQLQRLFLNLQTSAKSAVETTDLTQSFGWNVQQAWEQHDIQELCRVMFDALEQKFKDTKQANLINDLYEGKMLDYVTCLECRTEKNREDTFQDIPLPVRPFGSAVAYNSVEEALRAFVQPETLDGNNQYFCEKCNKKCDAHKGLKFTKFPYLLTLHLKRFDFDYNTVNRIKLNDKVVFPETLNLNSFIPDANAVTEDPLEERDAVVKCDDCSTTDSGSALDDESCQGTDASSTANGQDDNCADDDEGIDVSSGNSSSNNQQENEKNRLHELQGPYIYELFSIMIHSGSASGGHYYAYIKDFTKNQWFCFNDQSVTTVTNEDIHKTYGGGPQRGYYSGAYSSSTNAYMLMYRQIDKERNYEAFTVDEFPPHIKKLLKDMRDNEESERKRKEEEIDTVPVKVHCYNPEKHIMEEKNVITFIDTPLLETTEDARAKFKLQDAVQLEDCRLVAYSDGSIEYSFEANPFCATLNCTEFFLEIKKPGTVFDDYKPGGVMMKAYIITLDSEEVDGPHNIWVNQGDTVRDLQKLFAIRYGLESAHIVQETYSNQPHYLDEPNAPVKFAPKCNGYKLYVSNALNLDDSDTPFANSKLASIIDRFVHVVMLNVSIPETDSNTLDILSIPSLDMNQCIDRIELAAAGDRETNQSSLRVSPLPGPNSELFGDQSNSEDSSLSDSDRTLVGDAPGDNIGLLSSSSNSPADQHMASPTDGHEEDFPDYQLPQEEMNWDDVESSPSPTADRTPMNYYFKAHIVPAKPDDTGRSCKVLVDKRMTLGMLKKNIEPVVGVPMEYFKIFRSYPTQDIEWVAIKDHLSSLKDDDRLVVKLGRVLKENEYAVKVYHLQLNVPDTSTFLFDWIVGKEQLVSSAKREILLQAKKQHMIDIPYSKCRLRKRSQKVPGRIFMDDEKFEGLSQINDFFLQEIEGPERSPNELCVFVRQWFPSTLTLAASFGEVTVDKRTKDELKSNISALSGIPLEFLEIAPLITSFPCDMNVLEIQTKCNWNFEEQNLTSYPLHVYDDGSIFFYRDSREDVRELTREERTELNNSENQRLGRSETKSTYTRRRERGLKIYVDTSPKKDDEVFLD